jgi:hypothetical protein
MWEVLNVLRRLGRGENVTEVAHATGHSRKTVKRYRRLATELGWVSGVHEPDESLAAEVFRLLRPGPKVDTIGETEAMLLPLQERIEKLVTGPDALRLSKVHSLLVREGVAVPYSSLHRFAVDRCSFGKPHVTVRMAESQPGELAEVDFGRLGLVWDPDSERKRLAWVLVVTLPYSRHQYLHVTFTQKIPDLISGLEDAWEFFGGAPGRVVLDNLKAAVTKADRYDPVFERTFEEYAVYRGFVIDPAVPRMPTGKPQVERGVQYVRENFFRGETWLDIEHVRRDARKWCMYTAGLRTHGTTRKRPLEVFEAEEKAALLPLTRERFDTPSWATCKVHPDHSISFLKALYTVPTEYIGKTVTVRGDTALTRIYHDGKLIKTRPRQPPGGKDIDFDDYPKEKTTYTMRDPNRVIDAARQKGDNIGLFAERLLSGTIPWSKLRQGQMLLRLVDRYGAAVVDSACLRAISFDIINTKKVESIIQNAYENTPSQDSNGRGQLLLFPPRFLRDGGSFSHHTKGDTNGSQNIP